MSKPRPFPLVGLLVIGSGMIGLSVSCAGSRFHTPLNPIEPPETLERVEVSAAEMHAKLFEEKNFPTARTCGKCHPDHYREWAVSPHAYSQMSPVFNAMHASIVALSNGTFSDFCIRCHTQVGMQKNEPEFESNLFRHPSSREGITCIVCHRAPAEFGKVSGRFSVQLGDIYGGVYGPTNADELKRVIADKDGLYGKIYPDAASTPKGEEASAVHGDVISAYFLTQPGFCGVCHDVNLGNGFRLEEAFSEYKSSPAATNGVTCQDCHMGKEPGVFSGSKETNYLVAPAAVVNGRQTRPRKRTNHRFAGPDHSIVHPGLFPHLPTEDLKLANMTQWLQFDHEKGWGTAAFEDSEAAAKTAFPDHWKDRASRERARQILNEQFVLLEEYKRDRLAVLRAGYVLGDVEVVKRGPDGIAFKVQVRNGTDGHNVPTGFIAERTLYLEVTVTAPDGTPIFKSGDLDPNGDVRDSHSLYVHSGELPVDPYLFSLQSKFIVRMNRGGEREQVLAVNHSVDPLPFLRPATFSTILTGRPRGARTHRTGIPPLGERWPAYEVGADAMKGSGRYKIRIRLISGMVPPNLIDQIQHVGFDYGMSPREVARRVVEGRLTLWDKTIDLDI